MLDKSDAKKACIAFSIGAWATALVELIHPTLTAPTGRWSWLTGSIFNAAGSFGLVVLWGIVGSFLFLTGYKKN